ncbi:MAG: YaaA family protein [Acholeplasmataceae bacterium]|nr:YaaA family protein [Acholeplasmataceae bacterium]
MQIFISPAKTFSSTSVPSTQRPHFLNEAEQLIVQLKTLSSADLEKKMRLSAPLAQTTYEDYQAFGKNTAPAIFSYAGQQYRYLNPASLTTQALDWLNSHLYMISGLYGLLRPLDAISRYRLEMQDTSMTSLYTFWTPKIFTYLKPFQKQLFINLASKEYSQVLSSFDQLITIQFYQLKNDKLSIHSMELKKMRGLFLRAMALNEVKSLEDIKKITVEYYLYNSTLSNEKLLTFVKKV